MHSTTALESNPQLSGPPVDLQLTNWPARDDGLSGWILIVVFMGVAIVAGYVSGSVLMGLLSFMALAASVWRMWVPVKYEFGPKGILQTVMGRKRRIAWSTIRRHQVRSRGVLLLTSSSPVAMTVFGGIYIRWRDQRDSLVAIVAYYLGTRPNP